MSKRRIILVSVVCFSLTVLTAQTLPQAPMPKRSRNMTDAEWKKEIEKWRAQRKLERERKRKESKKRVAERKRKWDEKVKELANEGRGPLIDREKRRKELQEKATERRKEFLREKSALGVTEEQWKVIRPKLEKIRQLREQANSFVGAFLAGGSSDRRKKEVVPTWQWKRPWKDKAPSELTEAQKLAKELIVLVEKKNTSNESFRNKIAALRKARSKEAKLEKQLSEAQKELREILTTRQEAALVLMGRL